MYSVHIPGSSSLHSAFAGLRSRKLPCCGLMLLVLIIGLSGCSGEATADPLLFLGWDENGTEQLYRQETREEAQQLTDFSNGVRDYAPSPDGRQIIVSTFSESGDSVLWLLDADGSSQKELFTCLRAECANFSWAQDSRRLLFEQRAIESDGRSGTPSLWWLDTRTSDVLPLYADESRLGAFGRLSPDGQWVSFHTPQQESLTIYNLQDSRSHMVLNEIGTASAWSPDSRYLVAPMFDLVILHGDEGEDHEAHSHDYQTAVHLQRIDPESGEQLNLSGDFPVEDSAPAWSPDGQWIAFGRRLPRTDNARQLWVMRSDGSEVRALSDDLSINHGPPSWSADGRYLLFQQIGQHDLTVNPQIWRIDVESGEKELLSSSGMQPNWLPREH